MQKEAWRERVMQDGGVIPATGFPRDSGMEMTIRTRCKHEHLIQHTCIRSRAVVLGGYTFEACVSRRFKNVKGSSRSRVVVEVVVHTKVVELGEPEGYT